MFLLLQIQDQTTPLQQLLERRTAPTYLSGLKRATIKPMADSISNSRYHRGYVNCDTI